MIKVSIIIPIYNVENYLKECLDSVVGQTLKDIEIICVNDGSTDNSLAIIKDYAVEDSRIKIIDKKNSGYGHSMNIGIANASGEYIGIVEPDDYIKETMFESLYSLAQKNKLEFIKSSFYRFNDINGNRLFEKQPITKNKSYLNIILNPQLDKKVFTFAMQIWTGIYKKEFLENYKIKFNETAGASYQDNGFYFSTFSCAKKIMLLEEAFYFKRDDNPNSSVKNKEKVYCMKTEYEFINAFLDEKNIYENFKRIYIYIKYRNYMFNLKRIDKKYKKEFLYLFSSEFKESDEKGEIDKQLFKADEYKKLRWIIDNPKNYFIYSKLAKIKKQIFSINEDDYCKTIYILFIRLILEKQNRG